MKVSTILTGLLGLLVLTAVAACSRSSTQPYTTPDTKAKAAAYIDDPTRLSEKEISERARDAYVFGYPLVLMDVTREIVTSETPANTLSHLREFPDPSFHTVVAPNVDTLYTTAWLDLDEEPIVLSVPNAGDRYYVMQILDAWTNVVAAPGTRTKGAEKLEIAIVGPNYKGRIPRGLERVESPTTYAWIIGRIHTTGTPDDLAQVHAVQDEMRMQPLSVYEGKAPPKPTAQGRQKPSSHTKSPAEVVNSMDPETFFDRLNRLMAKNPPKKEDAFAMARFETIGISPGKPFSLDRYPKEVSRAIENGAIQGQERLQKLTQKPLGTETNGWNILLSTGDYGTDYDTRAAVARMGLGANLPEDAVYPTTARDSDGNPLDGRHRYVLHFEKDEIPPVDAFWSLTVYDEDQFLVKNDAKRYAVGSHHGLKPNADGSITIYLQSSSPGRERESNWLPIPSERFNAMLRLYSPQAPVTRGEWAPPPIERVRD